MLNPMVARPKTAKPQVKYFCAFGSAPNTTLTCRMREAMITIYQKIVANV